MQTREALRIAEKAIEGLSGHVFDVFTLARPRTTDEAVNYLKIISKLSPMVGNPEITARFKDSQNHFLDDRTYVALLAWLPESVIYGRPRLIEACVVSGMSVAKARDDHYHNPPDYLVLEPEDTRSRTRNLRQTNANGFKFQGTRAEYEQATKEVESWGGDGKVYRPTRDYQDLLRQLTARYKYRLDTNFAKIDRIGHEELETFKTRVIGSHCRGQSICAWAQALFSKKQQLVEAAVAKLL